MWNFFSKDPAKELVNFEIQEQIQLDIELQNKTIWSLNNAKKKGTTAAAAATAASQQGADTSYSVFSCLFKPGSESWSTPARNSFKRMKMLRHPNILMFQDGIENDKGVFIVTERVQPLLNYLRDSKDNESQKENEISWGLYQIATALSFLNNDCKLVHNNVCLSSIVVNRAGEWKLTGFEYTHSIDDQQSPHKVLNTLDRYEPPEKSPVLNLKQTPNRESNSIASEYGVDSWGLGCLIWEIFNGSISNVNALKNPGRIPKRLVPAYLELLNSQVNKRLTPSKFLNYCRQSGGFMDNHFVDTLLFLEQIQIKDQGEKTTFFNDLTQKLDDFPGQLCKFKILPQLLNAYEFGNAGSSVLAPLFKLGKLLDDAEYQKKIIPIVVKLFSSTDRATRMRLLQQLHLFIEHLSVAIINDQIFPQICLGFNDTNPAIRENTIRSMVLLAPKLNYNNLNVELMKHFARLQALDEQGMIRTNTTVCIGKIANYINPELRQRILLSAFPKAMRDPFPLARLSGIVAMTNTERFYTLKDISTRVLPSLCMLCIDPEKDVRDEAFKGVKQFLQKLEKVSESPELAVEMEKDVTACNLDIKNETSWTSWAMTSLSAKMSSYKTKNVQPSVALNTQPLSSATNSMSSPNLKDQSAAAATKPDDKTKNSPIKAAEPSVKQTPKTTIDLAKDTDAPSNTGWALDEADWKDLDEDGDLMEPFEPFETTTTSTGHSQSTQNKSNNDWSADWTNSFDDAANSFGQNHSKPKPASTNNKPDAQTANLPMASSYNWNNSKSSFASDSTKNEEDLFSSLIKDVNISNKPGNKLAHTSSNPKPTSTSNTTTSSGWGEDWNEWADNKSSAPNKDAKKVERQQRNQEKKQEMKQSAGPLKLGQKKQPDFF